MAGGQIYLKLTLDQALSLSASGPDTTILGLNLSRRDQIYSTGAVNTSIFKTRTFGTSRIIGILIFEHSYLSISISSPKDAPKLSRVDLFAIIKSDVFANVFCFSLFDNI